MKKLLLAALQKFFACAQRPAPTQIRSVVVVRQHDQLGDFLMSTPVFRELRAKYPQCRISVVVRPYVCAAAQANPNIDELIVYEPKTSGWGLRTSARFVRQIRKRYDLAIVLSTPSRSLTSDLIAFFSGARFRLGMAPRPEGDAYTSDFLYHATAPRPHPRIHQALENLTALHPLGISSSNGRQELFLKPEELYWAQDQLRLLGIKAPSILLLPGAGKRPNRWPAESFIALGKQVSRKFSLLVIWGPGQSDIGSKVLEGLREAGAKTIEGTSIRQLAALAVTSSLSICNDTGDLHVVASAGAKTLALFGPTDPATYLPRGEHVSYLRSETGAMGDLPVEAVLAGAQRLLVTGNVSLNAGGKNRH